MGLQIVGTVCVSPRGRGEGVGLTRDSWGHRAAQRSDGCHGDLLIREFLGAGVAWGDHVGLQQSAFQVDVMVTQSLVDRRQHLEHPKWGRGTGVSPRAPAQRPSPPHCPGRPAAYLFGHILTALQVMVPIGEDLRLHNGHDAVLWSERR